MQIHEEMSLVNSASQQSQISELFLEIIFCDSIKFDLTALTGRSWTKSGCLSSIDLFLLCGLPWSWFPRSLTEVSLIPSWRLFSSREHFLTGWIPAATKLLRIKFELEPPLTWESSLSELLPANSSTI